MNNNPLLGQVLGGLFGPLPRNDRGVELDLRTALLIEAIERAGLNRPERAGPARARAPMDRHAPLIDVPMQPCEVEERKIPGPEGPLRAVVFRPIGEANELPVLVYLHGGGFVIGSATSSFQCSDIGRSPSI